MEQARKWWSVALSNVQTPRGLIQSSTVPAVVAAILAFALIPNAAKAGDAYTYDPLGRLTKVLRGNGQVTTYAFDPASNRQAAVTNTVDSLFTTYPATSLSHVVGYADSGGWAASVGTASNFMAYGPYATLGAGDHVAAWQLMVDNNTADNNPIVEIDVNDATAGGVVASTYITRMQWTGAYQYQYFYLTFTVPTASAGHAFEYRVYYVGYSYVRLNEAAVL